LRRRELLQEDETPVTTIQDVCKFLETFAPLALAEAWDNVGLLVGDDTGSVERIMTCLTVTPDSAKEAIEKGAELVVSHHPLPFRPLKTLTNEDTAGRLLWSLASNQISIYSPHTAFDSTTKGINQSLAEGLQLQEIRPLIESAELGPKLGTGRWGQVPGDHNLQQLAARIKDFLGLDEVRVCGDLSMDVTNVAVACGSAGQFLPDARRADCDVLLTGEATFHTCLEAEATRVGLVLVGHYASERFAIERLADVLNAEFDQVDSWASTRESDPLQTVR